MIGVVAHTYVGTDLAVPHTAMVRPIIAASLLVVLMAAPLVPIFGWQRAALATMVVPLFMTELRPPPHAQVLLLTLPLILGLATELAARWRPGDAWKSLSTYLTFVGAAFVLLAAAGWVLKAGPQQLAQELRPGAGRVASESASARSMYLIMLDGYPRADTLLQHLGHDSALVSNLERLGFDHYVASRSNYPNTTLTTATLFNMAYLDDLGLSEGSIVTAPRQPRFRNALSNPAAFAVAREHGYEVVVVESGWDELTPTGADHVVHTSGLTQLEMATLRNAAIGPVLDLVHPHLYGDSRRGRIEQALNATADLAEQHGDLRLVWTHVPSPHFPLVYRSDGSPLLVDREKLGWFDLDDPALLDRYRDNVRHLDRLVIAAVERIVAADPTAIVVVLSDHGSLLELGGPDETLRNLMLARTPGQLQLLGASPTPIAVFPQLFNAYLGTDIAVPPHRSHHVTVGDGQHWELRPAH